MARWLETQVGWQEREGEARAGWQGPVKGWNLQLVRDEAALRWADEDDLSEVRRLEPLDWVRRTERDVLKQKRWRRVLRAKGYIE